MSTAGKLLAILNVLAAIGFVVVAGMDWAQRERWTYAVYRHDLLVEGLPADPKEQGPDLKPRVEKFDEPWFATMFQRAGGRPVKTVSEEIDNLQKTVAPPGTQPEKLAHYLHALARTYDERDRYGRIASGQEKVNEDGLQKLQNELAAQFDTVKEIRVGAEPGKDKRSNDERRVNAARLLFLLGVAQQEDPNADYFASPAYQRLLVVCGLNATAQALDDQAEVMLAMADQAVRVHRAELDQFVYELSQIIYDNQNLADATERLERKLKEKQDDVEKQKQLVAERKVELKRLTDRLATLRQDVGKNLDEQSRLEDEVMRRLAELRDTAKSNQELERQIRELEGAK